MEKEILEKIRPYLYLKRIITVNKQEVEVAIPFRSRISHKYGYKTIGEGGIDFSKMIVSDSEIMHCGMGGVNHKEYKIIEKNIEKIEKLISGYISKYCQIIRKKQEGLDLQAWEKLLIENSTLQNFHTYIM